MAMTATPREIHFVMGMEHKDNTHGGLAFATFTDTDKPFTEKYVRALIHQEFKDRLCHEHGGVVPTLTHLSSEFDGEKAVFYCAYKVTIKEKK